MRILVCLLALLWAAPNALSAYRCIDEKGATHFEDVPPAACANVTTYEISGSGAVVRKIDPASSPAEQKAGRVERERRLDTDRAAVDAKRRDRALLDSYTSDREIDAARDRNLDILRERLAAAVARMKSIEEREQQPSQLRADLEKIASEKSTLSVSIARYERDFEQTRAQFEADKKRWIELRGPR